MVFVEPAVPHGVAPYRASTESREAWLALAAAIEPEVAQYFLISARCGCFMQAARSLNIKATQLRKRLAQLEEQLRRSLFSYQGNVLALSREGQQLQAQLIALAHERRLPVLEQPLIRLAVAESILHDILGRDLIALLRRNASVRLEIISIDSELGLQALDADVVVWLSGMDSPGAGRVLPLGRQRCWRGWIIRRILPSGIRGWRCGRTALKTLRIICWCSGSRTGRWRRCGRGIAWWSSGWRGWCGWRRIR